MTTGPERPQFAVLGSPIGHSKSPALHTAAYRVLGFEADYRAMDVTGEQLRPFVESLGDEWGGLSLTMPLKEIVLPLLDSVDVVAVEAKAANTVRFSKGAEGRTIREGFNTDVQGIVRALGEAGLKRVASTLIIGAGATARSAMLAAVRLGCRRMTIAARSPQKAEELVRLGATLGATVSVVPLESLAVTRDLGQASLAWRPAEPGDVHVTAQLTISTLPGGALDDEIVGAMRVNREAVLLDVAYHPWPSALAAHWERGGGTVVSGLEMLVHQALLQVRIFTAGTVDTPLPDEARVLAAMRSAVGLG